MEIGNLFSRLLCIYAINNNILTKYKFVDFKRPYIMRNNINKTKCYENSVHKLTNLAKIK